MKFKGEKATEDAGTSRCNLFFTTQYCQTWLFHAVHTLGCVISEQAALPYPFYVPVIVATATASAQRLYLDGKLLVVEAFW